MRGDDLIALYQQEGALLEGHFVLRSGMHSDRYLQSALLLARPEQAARAGEALADLLREDRPETILSPALGGILVGHEVARALGVRHLFVERKEGRFVLRRGFRLAEGESVTVVEDVVTTGGSALATVELAESLGARVLSVGSLVDRSEGKARFPVPFRPAARLSLDVYPPDRCPLCERGVPLQKPGSRGVGA